MAETPVISVSSESVEPATSNLVQDVNLVPPPLVDPSSLGPGEVVSSGDAISTDISKTEVVNEDINRIPEWKSVLMNSVEKLFDMTKNGYSKNADANNFLERVFTELMDIRQTLMQLDKADQIKFADEIADTSQFMTVLVPFMAQVYKALSNGYELKCLSDWQFLLLTMTNISEKLRLKIVKENVHFEMIKQLLDLPKTLEHQELLSDLVKMAMYVMLTLIQEKDLRHYFTNCCYTDVLINYVPSKNFSIGKLAKISLSILHRHLDHDQAAKNLNLTPSDIGIILKVLSNQTLSEDEEGESWHILSKDGLVLALNGFCSLTSNCVEFVKQGGPDVLSTILDSSDDTEEQEATLLLLWQLSCHLGPGMATDASGLVDKIRQISAEDGSDLCALKASVPVCLLRAIPSSDEGCLTYVRTAFKHELYEECARFCEEVSKNDSSFEPSTNNTITLLHGKARYYIFKHNFLAVKKIPETSLGYSKTRRVCFEDAKQAIHLLGAVLDNNTIDNEGSQLLDTATMYALSESSSLKSDQRCLLCRSKQRKLARSHICPRAILDDFAKACGTPSSGKAFFVNWPWQSGLSGSLKSAGQITVKLLCHDCESILGKNETYFLPNFFRKFYDRNDPTRIEIEQEIEYGAWLYQFCIGLIFRGMIFQYSGARDEYLNEDEVYSVFVQCREALLESKSGPKVSLYMAPTSTDDESELTSSLINMVIHHPFHFFFTQSKGMYAYHQVFLHALSYTFQIGMIMTTVNFSLAHWTQDESSIISPSKGIFKVPPNCSRRHTIPDALWETLLAEAIGMEKEVREQPQRMALQPLVQLLSVPPTSYMKNIMDIATNSKGIGKGSSLQGHPKIVNYIPMGTSISHPHEFKNSTGRFELPSGHRVLLHLTTSQGDEQVGNTAFIMAGEGPGYGADRPYMIFHHYEPGHQTNYGYFFSPSTFEFVQYLPDRHPKRYLDDDFKSSGLMDKSKEIVSLVLRTKGFRNYHSLRYWTQAKRSPKILDTKCKYKSDFQCWFCNDSCEICLEPTVLGPSDTDSTGKILRFCSIDCCDVYKQTPKPHTETFSPDDQENSNRKVPVGHKEYVHLFSCGKLEDNSGCFVTSLSLCEGDGSEAFPSQQYYLNYYLQTPKYQCYFEFFVTDDLQALDAVSYPGALCNLFEQEDEEDIKQSALGVVSGTVRNSSCSCVSDLVEKIRLYDMMGSSFAAFTIGSDSRDMPSLAVKSPIIQPLESTAEKAEADTLSGVGQQPVLVVTPKQLLAVLNQCGGDHVKAAEMIGEIVESGRGSGVIGLGSLGSEGLGAAEKGKATVDEGAAGGVTMLEVGETLAGCEVKEEQEIEASEEDEEGDCQVQ